MSKEYGLDLLQNSIDSLNESINYYQVATTDELKYKFSIILLFHFMELILKYFVERINPLLCFEKPYSEKLQKEKTITWGQALQIIRNNGNSIEGKTAEGFIKLSNLRNDIIHYKFSFNTSELRKILVDVVSELNKMYSKLANGSLYDLTNGKTNQLLKEISDELEKELHLAKAEALEEAKDGEIHDCYICGSEGTVTFTNEEYYCHYCKETDPLLECMRCTEKYRQSEMYSYGENEYGDDLYMCESCEDHNYME